MKIKMKHVEDNSNDKKVLLLTCLAVRSDSSSSVKSLRI